MLHQNHLESNARYEASTKLHSRNTVLSSLYIACPARLITNLKTELITFKVKMITPLLPINDIARLSICRQCHLKMISTSEGLAFHL